MATTNILPIDTREATLEALARSSSMWIHW